MFSDEKSPGRNKRYIRNGAPRVESNPYRAIVLIEMSSFPQLTGRIQENTDEASGILSARSGRRAGMTSLEQRFAGNLVRDLAIPTSKWPIGVRSKTPRLFR